MGRTKSKIISAAIHLFNELGFVNVRLQNIADELKISVGNLAYHFKNKEAIVARAYDQVDQEFKEILSSYRTLPTLEDLDNQLEEYYLFIQKYPFYFIDILEIKRNFPHLHEKRKELILKMSIQFEKRIEYNQNRGIIISDLAKNQISYLAGNLCTTVILWHTSQVIKDQGSDRSSFKSSLWIQLRPFLTSKGKEEYTKYIVPGLSFI